MLPQMEKLLTIKEICEQLQVSQSLVYKWVHYDYIPHVKLGTLVRFSEIEVDRWLKNKTKKGRDHMRLQIEI